MTLLINDNWRSCWVKTKCISDTLSSTFRRLVIKTGFLFSISLYIPIINASSLRWGQKAKKNPGCVNDPCCAEAVALNQTLDFLLEPVVRKILISESSKCAICSRKCNLILVCSRLPSFLSTPCMWPGPRWPTTPVSLLRLSQRRFYTSNLDSCINPIKL